MSNFTVTIVGTGVIGTSMGLALKQQGDSLYVVGHDKELGRGKEAAKMGAFDKVEWNLINACEAANLAYLLTAAIWPCRWFPLDHFGCARSTR